MKELGLISLMGRMNYLIWLIERYRHPLITNHLFPRIKNIENIIFNHPDYLNASNRMRWILGLVDWKYNPLKVRLRKEKLKERRN